MSCQNEFQNWQDNQQVSPSGGGGRGDGCVESTVRRILNAERRAVEDGTERCVTSCEQSIEDLLSPSRDQRPTRYTTIPFMLQCRENCSTFIGSGFTSRDRRGDRSHHFRCVSSPVFKVRGFLRGSQHCVRLELLVPIYEQRPREAESQSEMFEHSICRSFGNRPIRNFRYTGVCITVDLRCFCGITCLDPITPAAMS